MNELIKLLSKEDIEKYIEKKEYNKNEIIFSEGLKCNYIGIVESGKISISTITYNDKEEMIKAAAIAALAIPVLGNFPPQPLPGGEPRALRVQSEPQGLGPPKPFLAWATPPFQSAPQRSLCQRVWSDRLYLASEQSSTQDGWIH